MKAGRASGLHTAVNLRQRGLCWREDPRLWTETRVLSPIELGLSFEMSNFGQTVLNSVGERTLELSKIKAFSPINPSPM